MKFWIVCFILSLCCACGDDGETENGNREAEIRALQGNLEAGKDAWQTNCASCHAADGSGTAIGPDVRDERDETIEVTLFGEDDMAPLDYLENQTIADIAEFVEKGFPQ